MNCFPPVITIDGPSGSGKGTLSKKLASILRWNTLDSGMIYRILALIALNNHIDISNEMKLVEIANSVKINFINKLNKFLIFYDNLEITQDIYTEVIGNVASKIAIFPKVREVLLEYQRSFCVFPGLVADGRDMGTVIFPNAVLKVFLNASVTVREQRRLLQLKNKFCNVTNVKFLILKNIRERDERDYNRKLAPLLPAVDALVLDSTYLSPEEITVKVFSYIKNNMLLPSDVLYNIHS